LTRANMRTRCSIVACGTWLLVLSSSERGHATTFADRLGGTAITQPIAEALSRAIVRSLPLTSASAGIAETWDESMGPLVVVGRHPTIVYRVTSAGNVPSLEMQDGMIEEARLVERVRVGTEVYDEVLFRMLKHEWEQQLVERQARRSDAKPAS
jgi:hypothetical protein